MSPSLPPKGRGGWVGKEGALLVLEIWEGQEAGGPLRESMRGELRPSDYILGSGSWGR